MEIAEEMLKYIIQYVLDNAPEEMEFFNSFVDKGLLDRLHNILDNEFGRVTYTEAVELLTSIARGELMETVVVGTMDGVETVEKEADIKTRITALKEILKRYPGNDKLVEQQVRKLTADADMAEARVRLMNDDRVSSDAKIVIVDSWG